MSRRVLVIVGVLSAIFWLLLAVKAASAMQLVAYNEATMQCDTGGGACKAPLYYHPAQDDWRSDEKTFMWLGLPPLQAGDLLDIRVQAQLVNPNSKANGWWGVARCCDGLWVQSEHWTLWTMGAVLTRMNGGTRLLPVPEQNFDNFQHYWSPNLSGFYRVPAAIAAPEIDVSFYFVASKYYVSGSPYGYVAGGGQTKIEVAVYR